MARRGEIPSKPPMEEAIAAAEATLEALVKAAEDFAVPLIAEQRAVLAAADAKAADAASPARDAFETVRAEFEKKIDELDGALTSAVEKERAEIAVVARAAREDPFAEDEDADVATIVASVFDPAREHLGERLRNSRSAAEKMLQWLEIPKNFILEATKGNVDFWGRGAQIYQLTNPIHRMNAINII